MLTFDKRYFFIAVTLFIVEVLIALFVKDGIVRPYVGDFLVVILLYAAVRTFLQAPALGVALGVLCFSYIIEAFQYFQVLRRLRLQDNEVVRTVMGYGFDWIDILAYTLGIIAVLAVEKWESRRVRTVARI